MTKTVLIVLFDLLEVVAVFLLAVEAIKLKNIKHFRKRFFIPLYRRINPEIKYVDELPADTPLYRYSVMPFFLALYLFGAATMLYLLYRFGIWPLAKLLPTSVLGWVFGIFGAIFIPLLIGGLIYTGLVKGLEFVIHGLTWIESNTHKGIVGIMGFAIYLAQFVGRRLC